MKKLQIIVLSLLLVLTLSLTKDNTLSVSADSYGSKTSSVYQPYDAGYGSGVILYIDYPESVDPEDASINITYRANPSYDKSIYQLAANGETVSLGISSSGTTQKTISYSLDSGDIDSGNPSRYKIVINNVMYGSGGVISQGSCTLYININVSDETAPLLNGTTGVYLVNYDTPTTVSAFKSTLTATDETDGDLTSSIIVDSDNYTGNEAVLGDHSVVFSVQDNAANKTTITVIFRVVDITNPIINLVGGTVNVEYGSSFVDPGSSATDNYDGSISVVKTGTVDEDTLGTYTLYYNATDSSGNAATEKTRTVNVIDTTKPVQTLNGSGTIYIEFGSNYTEQGASWSDLKDGTGSSVITGSVNVGVLGTYTLYYNYTDSSGNVATQLTRTVIVQDTSKPVFSGENDFVFNTGNELEISTIIGGITALDIYDGDLTSNITISSDNYTGHESETGTYTVILTAEDSQGNSENYTVSIQIIDNQAPVFSTSETIFTTEYADTLTQDQIKEFFGV